MTSFHMELNACMLLNIQKCPYDRGGWGGGALYVTSFDFRSTSYIIDLRQRIKGHITMF